MDISKFLQFLQIIGCNLYPQDVAKNVIFLKFEEICVNF